jgi:hypothetical protein
VLDKGTIPRVSENECRDENVENEEEKLSEHIRLGLRLGDTIKNLHFTY